LITTFLKLKFLTAIGNEGVPKIIINNAINFFFKTVISILVISNHHSFQELFNKIAYVVFNRKR